VKTSSHYRIAVYEVPSASEDLLVAALWAVGCAGSWTRPVEGGRSQLEASFEDDAMPSAADLRSLAIGPGADLVEVRDAPDTDWRAVWRAAALPIPIGDRFLVDPREPGESDPPVEPGSRSLLRLPARTAFGVGSHESTRLAVELIEATPVAGRRVLDVGTGSGILAFAALRLGALSVVALDVDPSAALLLPQAALAGTVDALDTGGETFDVALVNVVPREIGPDLRRLSTHLAAGATALFSGILIAQAETALATLARCGFVERSRRTAGEWVAFATEWAP
jgi:ribosomal protein L11 methyltransferase